MTYCPECGSEVAPENTFCAYCGIALTPVFPPIEEVQPQEPSSSFEINKDISVSDIKNESEFPVLNEEKKSKEIKVESAEELPATRTTFNNQTSEKDVSAQLIEPEQKTFSNETGAEDFPANNNAANSLHAEVDALSPMAVDTLKQEDESPMPASEMPVQSLSTKMPEANFFLNQEFVSETAAVKKLEAEENLSDNVAVAETLPSEGSLSEAEKTEIDNGSENEMSFNVSEASDFQATIPYSSKEIANQEMVPLTPEASLQETQPEQPPVLEQPIAMPEMPVGSSAHDSLEPTLISVQIFNPHEQSENAVQKKEESIPQNQESVHDSQTLMRHDPHANQNEPARSARPYTSPNMGREDTDGRDRAKLKPLDEGTVLNGRYEVVRKIGGGGMGAVYLASDRNLGGVLRAVKEMVQSYIEDAQQEKAVNDFRRESLLLTSLEHQSIPTIFDYFYDEKEGRFYLVMKYISGGDLAARLRSAPEGKIDEASVTEWAIQIADVLDYLHNRQPAIIYRDLKPSNVMIDGNSGRAMLIDFGIARWVNKEEKGVTAVGTMGYAPPELFSGNVEPRSDIYSLGSTMFHLLTGADPQSNPLLIFDFHKNPRPRQINSRLSDQIEQILMRMVEYNYEKRFGSAAELRSALIKHLENLRKGAVTFGTADQVPAASAANELVFCGFCGQKIVATDMFCPFCGAQQPLAGQAGKVKPAAYIAPKLTARIMVISTNELDTPMFNLEKDNNLVGRRDPMSNIFPEVDLSKFDPQTKISRRHARIWRQSETFMLEDLGSSNGTVLITQTNETLRLTKNQPHALAHGDKIRLGDTMLHFMLS